MHLVQLCRSRIPKSHNYVAAVLFPDYMRCTKTRKERVIRIHLRKEEMFFYCYQLRTLSNTSQCIKSKDSVTKVISEAE